MCDVKWIKLTTDMFDNRKIKYLRRLPDGNSIVLIWVMLLTMAGRCNAGGMIFLTENIPYTPKILADELDFEENTIILALKALSDLNMVHYSTEDGLSIPGWSDHQSVDRLQEIREYNRLAKQRSRERLKITESDVNDMSMTSQRCQETDIDKDKEKESEEESDTDSEKIRTDNNTFSKENVCRTANAFLPVVDAWNESFDGTSVAKVKTITADSSRGKMLAARLAQYGLPNVLEAIKVAAGSDFLCGRAKDFVITFDWFVKPNNFCKVMEGQYANRQQHSTGSAYIDAINNRMDVVTEWAQKHREDNDDSFGGL